MNGTLTRSMSLLTTSWRLRPSVGSAVQDLVSRALGHTAVNGTLEPTGKRFEDIGELYIFRVRHGKLTDFVAVKDNRTSLGQLGFELKPPGPS